MNALIILFLSLIGLGIFSYLIGKRKGEASPTTDAPHNDIDECCGQHLVCEKESLLTAMSKEIEYYDDEELDAFKAKSPADYNDEEVELFRSVLYTLAGHEVESWLISLQLRDVALPLALRDEAMIIVQEQRQQR